MEPLSEPFFSKFPHCQKTPSGIAIGLEYLPMSREVLLLLLLFKHPGLTEIFT